MPPRAPAGKHPRDSELQTWEWQALEAPSGEKRGSSSFSSPGWGGRQVLVWGRISCLWAETTACRRCRD